MAFFDIITQLRIDGVWTDVSTDVRQADGVTVSRGRADEASTVEPSSCSVTLNNRDGNYSPRNPVGAYYGLIGRNTPLRVLTPLTVNPRYMALPGAVESYASTPDAAGLDITGDIDVRLDIEPDTWRPPGGYGLAQKHLNSPELEVTAGSYSRSWTFWLDEAGTLAFEWTPDSTGSAAVRVTSTVAVPSTPGRLSVRVTLDVDNGAAGKTATFYTKPFGLSGTWTQLGDTVTTAGVTSIFSGTADLDVGRSDPWTPGSDFAPVYQGKVYGLQLRSGIDGTVVASPDFTAQDSGDTEFTDGQGNPWTLRGRAVMAHPGARFHGEVSSWPQRWDKSGNDVYTPLQAFGVLRRLGQGQAGLRSTLYRTLTSDRSVVQYWPCEDGSDATELASAKPNRAAMYQYGGDVSNASFDGFKASEPIPTAGESHWIGKVASYTETGIEQVTFLMAAPSAGVLANAGLLRVRTTGGSGPLVGPRWDLDVSPTGGLRLRTYNDADVMVMDTGELAWAVNGRLLRVSIRFEHTGPDIAWDLEAIEVGEDSVTHSTSGTLPGRTLGRVIRIGVAIGTANHGELGDVAIGHVSVHNSYTPLFLTSQELRAHAGETASARVLRLCEEADIPVKVVGDVASATPLGPQLPAPVLDLLQEAAAADMGVLFEPREFLGLAYRSRASMYAQDATLTLDYTAGTVSGIEPTEDDDTTRNDITVTRVNGSSVRAQLETGPLSVNAPPDGVGRYDDEVEISVERDADLANQASWRLHVGTVDEARYPVLGVNLAAGAFTSDPTLTDAAQDLDIGDRIVVTNAPSHTTSPDDIQQIAQGFTETLGQYEWLIDVNCAPASPYDVGVWDDSEGPGEARYSSDGTTTTQALTTTGTVIPIDTPTGPLWSAEDGPFDITIGGERMTVTDVVTNVDGASFETNEDWVESGTDVSVTQSVFASGVLDGAFCAAIDIDAAPTSTVNGVGLAAAAVVAGEWLAARIPVRPGGTTPVAGGRVRIEWFNSAGASISSTTGARQALSAFQYGALTYSAQAPANTASARVYLFLSSSGSDVPPANSTAHTDAWAVAAAASQAEALALVGSGYGQQFMAVTRSVNGVVKSHDVGAEVALYKPARYAL